MKILVICYCYPPDPGPRAYRWSAIARHWAAAGHEVHVISARKGGAPTRETLDGVEVHRVGGAISENVRIRLERLRGGGGTAEPSDEGIGSTGFSGWARWLKLLHDATWQKIYWPESACLWYFPAARKALELARRIAFDNLISVSTPFTGHLVGKRVKGVFPDLHWLVDIGDPFSFGEPPFNNERLHAARNLRSERALFASADAISVTVRSCAEEYARRFPESAAKIAVIPPLYSAPAPAPEPEEKRGGKARLVFTGSLYAAIRNPGCVLEIMAHILPDRPNFELHFYGRVNDCAGIFEAHRAKLGGQLFVHGPVPRDEAQAAVAGAHALINIGNATRFQLPSKLVDYAASGKPIVNLVSVPDDAAVGFLENYPQSLTVVEETALEARELARLTTFLDNAEDFPPDAVSRILSPYGIDAVTAGYLQSMRA